MATMVFVIVVIGGITRLTESGLSITEWKPITGAIPPLNEADWVAAFEKYKRIPEYTEINGPATRWAVDACGAAAAMAVVCNLCLAR